MFKDLSIIIPAYNEEKIIGQVLAGLKQYAPEAEIIVVDDGSADNTHEIARQAGVTVIRHRDNIGYGAALKRGIAAAGRPYILIMDADGQHQNYDDIKLLYGFIHEYDMVVGARIKGSPGSLHRRLGKWLLSRFASYLVERPILDLNSGFRMFRKDVVQGYFHILSNEFSFTTTITLTLLREGYRVKYVPITVQPRVGKSTVRVIRHGMGTLFFILRIVALFNPLRVFIPCSFILLLIGLARLFQGLLSGVDYTITAIIGIVSAVIVFMFGLLADQISALRRERHHLDK